MTRSPKPSQSNEKVCVAVLRGAHGVKGEVRLKSFTEDPEACFAYGPLKTESGDFSVVPVTWRPVKDGFVITTSVTRDREFWEGKKGVELFVDREVLPEPEEDEFYFDDLVGLAVVHADNRPLGRVKAVHNFGAQDILELVAPDERTSYMIPFTKESVPHVDLGERQLTADIADAYLPKSILEPETDQEGED